MNEEVNGPWNAFQCQWTCKWNCRLWIKWQHHLRAQISSIRTWYIYIYYIWSIYDDAERPAVYFDGCLSSEWSQLNCVTWKCLNIIKANLIIIIEARRTTNVVWKRLQAIWDALMAFDVVRHIINMLSVPLWLVSVWLCEWLSVHQVPECNDVL